MVEAVPDSFCAGSVTLCEVMLLKSISSPPLSKICELCVGMTMSEHSTYVNSTVVVRDAEDTRGVVIVMVGLLVG